MMDVHQLKFIFSAIAVISFLKEIQCRPVGGQKLLVISFDGFRIDYLINSSNFMPWFSKFKSEGVYADQVQSVFPSETFPNHYSIVTGMYPESHGVVSNAMFDPAMNKSFSKADSDPKWWNQAEPIWVTAEKQGFKTSVLHWPGSIIKFPELPSYYLPVYNNLIPPMEQRINMTVNRFANDEIDLGLIYYFQPDSEGHSFGSSSQNIGQMLKEVDWYMSYLMMRLDELGLSDKINIVICSDHGMYNMTKYVYLEDYLNATVDVERITTYGPIMNLQPKQGRLEDVYRILKNAADSDGTFQVFKKADVPQRLHYSNNDRIMDIVIIGDLGVYIKPTRPAEKRIAEHGWDPRYPEMHPLFMARGPVFKSGGYRMELPFEVKDIYALMARIVGIDPRQTNASLTNVSGLLRESTIYPVRTDEQRNASESAHLALFAGKYLFYVTVAIFMLNQFFRP